MGEITRRGMHSNVKRDEKKNIGTTLQLVTPALKEGLGTALLQFI